MSHWWGKALEQASELNDYDSARTRSDICLVSSTLHLHSTEPLFKRLVSISGTTLLMKPLPPFVAEFAYASVLESLGIKDLSPADRIKALIIMQFDLLYSKVSPAVPLMPVVDNDLIPGTVDFSQISTTGSDALLPGKTWCQDLLIGDCKFDVSRSSDQSVWTRLTV